MKIYNFSVLHGLRTLSLSKCVEAKVETSLIEMN